MTLVFTVLAAALGSALAIDEAKIAFSRRDAESQT
jgi:hypothetical protein